MVTTPDAQFTIKAKGRFSLREAATFGFGQRLDSDFDGVMRLAFVLDGYRQQVGVEVRQDCQDIQCTVVGGGPLPAVERQVARVLSLDFDGGVYEAVADRDPVVARLQAAAPGLRPPLFYSPYEAAVWVVLSARRPRRQMAEVRRAMSEAYGQVFTLAGQRVAALPTPTQLLEVAAVPGLSAEKVERMHGIAEAALAGDLDVERIQTLGPEQAQVELRKLAGIGKFYASLIVIRASGFADVLPSEEPHLGDLVARLYELPAPPTSAQLAALAEAWKPMRTWVTVLMRAAGPRVLAGPGETPEDDPMFESGRGSKNGKGRAPRQR